MSKMINVKDFGAVGDGITDDSKALQAAFDKAANLGAGVYFEPRTYKIDATLDWPSREPDDS